MSGPIGFEHERIAVLQGIVSSNRRIATEYLADSLRSSLPENRNSRRPPLGGETALNTERSKVQTTIDRLKRHQQQEIQKNVSKPASTASPNKLTILVQVANS